MSAQTLTRLKHLGQTDGTLAPLTYLQAEVLCTADDAAWEAGLPSFAEQRLADDAPLLHGQTLAVEPARVQRLFERLAAIAAKGSQGDAASVRGALAGDAIPTLALLQASIVQDAEQLEGLAAAASLDHILLATLGQLATVPLLQACARRAAAVLAPVRWDAGYCPVCAAWPTLAELRGLERQPRLRCGRCGADWPLTHGQCAYCRTFDHRVQGYLAPEADRESRRAATCEQCRGYLKTLATIGAIPPLEIALQDLTSLELDLAALERGYARPRLPGFRLQVTLVPAQRAARWQAWRR